jgi:RNA-binding protein 25
VDQIPTDIRDLFEYAVDWSAVERHKIIDNTMKQWVVKKIIEYLGEEEATLTEFILSKLRAQCRPEELLKELAAVLDEDAEQFMVKMWRMLIFSYLKQQS